MVKKANNKSGSKSNARRQSAPQQSRQQDVNFSWDAGRKDGLASLKVRSSVRSEGNDGDIRIVGSEILGSVPVTINNVLAFVSDLNPSTWGGTRVATMSNLFERYRINSIRFTAISSASATGGGTYAMYIDTDPNDKPQLQLSSIMSQAGAVASILNSSASVTMKFDRGLPALYTGAVAESSLRELSFGIFYLVVQGGNFSGAIIKVDYDVSLMTPQTTYAPPPVTPWTYEATFGINSAGGVTQSGGYFTSNYMASSVPGTIYEVIPELSTGTMSTTSGFTALGGVPYFVRAHSYTGQLQAYSTYQGSLSESDEQLITLAAIAIQAVIKAWIRRIFVPNT